VPPCAKFLSFEVHIPHFTTPRFSFFLFSPFHYAGLIYLMLWVLPAHFLNRLFPFFRCAGKFALKMRSLCSPFTPLCYSRPFLCCGKCPLSFSTLLRIRALFVPVCPLWPRQNSPSGLRSGLFKFLLYPDKHRFFGGIPTTFCCNPLPQFCKVLLNISHLTFFFPLPTF